MLGIVDLAGAGVADSAYPALVVAVCGVMLLVGAFFGRAGGIILLGLVAAIGMAGATASSRWDDQVVRMPATANDVQDRYELGAGELVLDLTDVSDPQNLDGRTIELRTGAGSVEVLLPDGLDVDVTANVGLGDADVFGDTQDGGGIDMVGSYDGGVGVPDLDLDIEVGLGEVDVHVVDDDDRSGPMSDTTERDHRFLAGGRHPVNVGHLVMGLAFLGLVGIWALIVNDVVDDEDIRWLLPVPWVLAGLGGLTALAVSGSRRYATRATGWVDTPPADVQPNRSSRPRTARARSSRSKTSRPDLPSHTCWPPGIPGGQRHVRVVAEDAVDARVEQGGELTGASRDPGARNCGSSRRVQASTWSPERCAWSTSASASARLRSSRLLARPTASAYLDTTRSPRGETRSSYVAGSPAARKSAGAPDASTSWTSRRSVRSRSRRRQVGSNDWRCTPTRGRSGRGRPARRGRPTRGPGRGRPAGWRP